MLCPTCGAQNSPEATSCSACKALFVHTPNEVADSANSEQTLPASVLAEPEIDATTEEALPLSVPSPEPEQDAANAPAEDEAAQVATPSITEDDLPDAAPQPLVEDEPLSEIAEPGDGAQTVAHATADADLEPVAPLAPKQRRSWQIRAALVLLIVLLLGSGVAVFVNVTRPQPSIRLTSAYMLGTTPVGASGTTLHISGQNFPSQAKITFLLDGKTAPGSVTGQSNSQGAINNTLAVTDAWPAGKHTLTAKDTASSTITKGIAILIVSPGQDKTPGPNDAPTDSASGTITATIAVNLENFPTDGNATIFQDLLSDLPGQVNLVVTAGAHGGTVCGKQDDGKVHPLPQPNIITGSFPVQATPGIVEGFAPHTIKIVAAPSGSPGSFETVTTNGTFSATCSGTYQSGHLVYTETYTSETTQTVFPVSGVPGLDNITTNCTLTKPYVAMHLEGTFTSPTSINGTYSSDAHTMHCTGNVGFYDPHTGKTSSIQDQTSSAQTGSWSGLAAMRDPTAPVVPQATVSATASTCFLNPAGPAIPTIYEGSATPTTGPTTAPAMKGTPVTLPDGLRYVDIKVGSGTAVTSSSTITTNYTGWLASTCRKFDSSYDSHTDQSGQTQPVQPATFQLGQGQLIKGWEEGLVGMHAGGIRRLYIPAALAYGDQSAGPVPPNADLIFDVQILSVK